ncbi:MAG: glycogen-binding domain-containing protein [Candidatus Krumholzibacteriales bacterium]
MKGVKLIILLAIMAAAILLSGPPAWTEVKLDGEEVIFNYHGRPGKTVYLVGDFNGWNSTIDRMVWDGSSYSVRLFLLPNRYSYRFVVDGERLVDPDNPARDEEGNSVFYFVEEDGGYRLYFTKPGASAAKGIFEGTDITLNGLLFADRDTINFAFSGRMESRISDYLFCRAAAGFTEGEEPFLIGSEAVSEVEDLRFRGFYRTAGLSFDDPLRIIGPAGPYNYPLGLFCRGIEIEKGGGGLISGNLFIAERLEGYRSGLESEERASGETGGITVTERDPAGDEILGAAIGLKLGKIGLRYLLRQNRGYSEWKYGDEERLQSAEELIVSGLWGEYELSENSFIELELLLGESSFHDYDSLAKARDLDIPEEMKEQSGWKLYAGLSGNLSGMRITGCIRRDNISNFNPDGEVENEKIRNSAALKVEGNAFDLKYYLEFGGEVFQNSRGSDFWLQRSNPYLDSDLVRPLTIPFIDSGGIFRFSSKLFETDSTGLSFNNQQLSAIFICDSENISKRVLELRLAKSFSLSYLTSWDKLGGVDLITDFRGVAYELPGFSDSFLDIFLGLGKGSRETAWFVAGLGFNPYRIDRWKSSIMAEGRELFMEDSGVLSSASRYDLPGVLDKLRNAEEEISSNYSLSVEAGFSF